MKPFVRAGICVLVAFAVLAHGAVEPWSEAVLEIGAGLLLVAWACGAAAAAEPRVVGHPLLWPLLGLWGVAAIQLAAHMTVYPFLTRIELLKYSALLALFFLAVQAFGTLEQWRKWAWFLLVLGFLVSVFGIVQHFTFNEKLYWFRELRYGGIPFGPFVNRNHFAGFVELVIPSGLAFLLLRSEKRDQLPLIALFTLFPVGALFLSASRGGIVGFVTELGVLAILIPLRRRDRKPLAAGLVVLILGAALVSWLGIGRALDRFASYQLLEASGARRAEMVRDSWRIFRDHPLAGTGLGTLQEVFPLYETMYDGLIVNHSHNDYVEILAEAGIAGGACCLAFLIGLFWLGWRNLAAPANTREFAVRLGALAACCGLLVHSLVDFNLHIPSNALIFLLQAAAATSFWPPSRPEEERRPASSGRNCVPLAFSTEK